MASKLVIVESPAKARTLKEMLGKGYVIKASLGHVRDLPKKELGINLMDFAPKYVVLFEKRRVIREIKEAANSASAVYLATDPDREGESISWHLIEATKLKKDRIPIRRIVFHEITKEAIEQALQNPQTIDMKLVNAQQARRLLDRLVGYKLSPLLWRKVQSGLSAGRVQSAAVKIIVDRERQIQDFIPQEYWTIEVELTKLVPENKQGTFRALLIGLSDGTKVDIPNQTKANTIATELIKASYTVSKSQTKETIKQPAPPFTTSTLQQEAWRKLRFSAHRTMAIAQQLYEGLPIGDEGLVGLITYMRTDSTHVAPGAVAEMRDFITQRYGSNFLPSKPRIFAQKQKFTQEAHEAIRPTKVFREPSQLIPYLKSEQLQLYELIWKRAVASQMAASIFDITTVEIEAERPDSEKRYLLRATSSTPRFFGFMVLYIESKDEEEEDKIMAPIPTLERGDRLKLLQIIPEQHFTQPPPRYTEATLIKALEQKGIGRPSTYAPILATIQERRYVHKENGSFRPDELGFIVNDLLSEHFPKIVDLGFTAKMEEDLDNIARGKKEWVPVLRNFYTPFEESLRIAFTKINKISFSQPTDEVCPNCHQPMVIKRGRYGKFLACSNYPECKVTMPFLVKTGASCPECGQELVQRTGKKGRIFYGCSAFPKCKFTIRYKPLPESCPRCGKLLIVYRKGLAKCSKCSYKRRLEQEESTG